MAAPGSGVRAQPTAAAALPAAPDAARSGPVLLLDEEGAAPQAGLLLALRIQLGEDARVEARPAPAGLTRAGRTQAAATLLAAEQARAVVWTEASQGSPPGEDGALTFFVLRPGSQGGADALDAQRVEGPPGPDLDRTIALKVSEIMEQAQTSSTPSEGAAPAPGSAVSAARPPEVVAPAPAWRFRLLAQLAAMAAPVGATGFGPWGPALGAGVSLRLDALRFGALAEVTWLPAVTREDAGARVQVQELTPALRLSAQTWLGSLWLGPYTAVAWSVVRAEASSADGMVDDASELSPSWLAGAGIELPLSAGFGLALDLGVQVRLRRQRFSVEGRELADSGRARPVGRLALSFRPGDH